MDVSTIHSELKKGITRKFYIFTGDEWAVQQIYIQQILACLKHEFDEVQYKRIDSATEILTKISNRTFVPTRYLFVARDDKQFMNEEKLQEQIEKKLGDNCFILLLTNPDKRTKFWKKYANEAVTFEPLKEKVLKDYVYKKINLSDKNLTKLINICKISYATKRIILSKISRINCIIVDYCSRHLFILLS